MNIQIRLIRSLYDYKFAPCTPLGKPRMVRSDKNYKKILRNAAIYERTDPKKLSRARTLDAYWRYINYLKVALIDVPIDDEVILEARLPYPMSWPAKKVAQNLGCYHITKPDADNILKGVVDALVSSDQRIAFKMAWKLVVRPEDAGIGLFYKGEKYFQRKDTWESHIGELCDDFESVGFSPSIPPYLIQPFDFDF